MTFWPRFPRVPRSRVIWCTVSRLLFLPFFLYLCNYQPMAGRRTSVWFADDWLFIVGGSLLGLTSGYLSSICLMYAPKSVSRPEHAELAAMMAGFSMILGIFGGLAGSYLVPFLV